MSAIKYYSLDGDEEVPCEFVVVRNVNGKPEFCASFVNTNCLAYENGVLLKYHERNDELRAENAKLREQLAKARDPQRIGGTADPESFVYAIEQLREFRWQHATNDEEAIPYINNVADAHERENAKLRELASELWVSCPVHDSDCDECKHKGGRTGCELYDRMRELGVMCE